MARTALFEVANMLLVSGQAKKIKIVYFIMENIDELVKEYSEEYQRESIKP